jgi:hypothetical protein
MHAIPIMQFFWFLSPTFALIIFELFPFKFYQNYYYPIIILFRFYTHYEAVLDSWKGNPLKLVNFKLGMLWDKGFTAIQRKLFHQERRKIRTDKSRTRFSFHPSFLH